MRVARGIGLAALVALVLLGAAACGGSTSPRDAYAKKLSSACNDMRRQVEALGKPSDTPLAKLYPPQVKIGKAFVKQVATLTPPAAEKKTVASMLSEYGYYFEGLRLGYALLVKRDSQQAFVQTVAGAVDNLNLAKGFAKKLGAPDCARDAFQ
jgi:hypothetical protein